ncbi:hypothetical protein BKA70DRAFT_228963 [Coprinopsis sp. MPI-PUGE-AT-0042]|nr:hypothetical protein BKA70DRAFT_228963 [Coprinopsis sp. MPI-PUGE-AT-0042]
MAPFCIPKVVVSGVKERIDSLLAQGDRLYLGSSLGHVHVYGRSLEGDDSKEPSFQLLETRKSVARKSIEQMGFIKDVNSLVVLSGMCLGPSRSTILIGSRRNDCHSVAIAYIQPTTTPGQCESSVLVRSPHIYPIIL